MQLNLDTIIIFVRNVDDLKPFYVDVLKLEIVEEIKYEWLLLKAGNGKIGLHKIGDKYINDGNNGSKFNSNTKIVFEIEADIYAVRERLIRQNAPMKEIKTFDNYGFLLCDGEDPEGNVFQLKQRK